MNKALAENRFREDLFYRLAVVVIKLPSLREREGDIRLLAQAFLNRFSVQNGKESLAFEPDALRALDRHAWPGNVRELENRVKRSVIMADGPRITAADLELKAPTEIPGNTSGVTSLKEARELLERQMITEALRRHAGKISPAAAELEISRPTMYELMEKLAIDRHSMKAV